MISDIRAESIDALRRNVPAGMPVALLDFPNHINAGDTMIHRGQVQYLHELGCDVDYLATLHTYDRSALDAHAPGCPILLQGGGNFGDRYPVNQLFRERIIDENPDRRIVQLPQTLHYSSADELRRTRDIYARHRNLTILIRDRNGVGRAAEYFPTSTVEYCPDLAFGIGPLTPAGRPDHDVVLLKRTDSESAHPAALVPAELRAIAYVHDWRLDWFGKDLRWWPQSLAIVAMCGVGALRRRVFPYSARVFESQSTAILRSAIATLSRGAIVVTDRLHAAILGVLLGKPVVMVDNTDHKVAAAYQDYLRSVPDVRLADDFEEATSMVRSMAGSS